MQNMSYLDRKEAIEDFLREGPPPPEDELTQLSNYNSFLNTKLKLYAAENLALKMQLQKLSGEPKMELTLAPLERSYCGEEMGNDFEPEVFYNLGAHLAAESGVQEQPLPEWPHEFTWTPMEDMYKDVNVPSEEEQESYAREAEQAAYNQINAHELEKKRELESLAVFFKYHYDQAQFKRERFDDLLQCRKLERQIADSYEQQCVRWMFSDEATSWFMELFNDHLLQQSELKDYLESQEEDAHA
jgi:hypothetical protein